MDAADVVNIKLADYGISRFANPGGVKGEEGTPGYLAPEAIRRRGEDQAFDEKVWMYEITRTHTHHTHHTLSQATRVRKNSSGSEEMDVVID